MKRTLVAKFKSKNNIYIFGAGKNGQRILNLLESSGVKVEGFLVTSATSNPSDVLNHKVYDLSDIECGTINPQVMSVILSIPEKEILKQLLPYNFNSITSFEKRIREEVFFEESRCKIEEISDYVFSTSNSHVEPQFAIIYKVDGCPLARYVRNDFMYNCDQYANQHLKRLDQFISDFTYFHCGGGDLDPEIRAIISAYVFTSHLDGYDINRMEKENYIPIQAGAALTDIRKGCITDLDGVSISDRNADYSECTAIYWIWKNTSGDKYVELNHYRRRIMLNSENTKQIIKDGFDCVVTIPTYYSTSIRKYFLNFVSECDWELLDKTLARLYPQYIEKWEQYGEERFVIPCNIGLWKREWFDQYCEFAFSISEEIYEFYVSKNVERNSRYMGYLFEIMSTFFIYANKNKMKIGYADMKYIP